MPFGYLSVDGFLHPIDGVNYFVSPSLFHDIHSPLEFGVDDPNEQEAFFLEKGDRDLFNGLITKAGVLNGNPSGGLGSGQPPWRIHHDHIKLPLSHLSLSFDKIFEVEFCHVCTDGHRIISDIRFGVCINTYVLITTYCYLR